MFPLIVEDMLSIINNNYFQSKLIITTIYRLYRQLYLQEFKKCQARMAGFGNERGSLLNLVLKLNYVEKSVKVRESSVRDSFSIVT